MKNILGCSPVITIFIGLFLSACVTILSSTNLEQNARAVTALLINPTGYGSGVLISPNKVLTAKHLTSTDNVFIHFYDGVDGTVLLDKGIVGETFWQSDNADLALLSIPEVDIPPVDIACQMPEIGTPVFIIGQSGFGVGWTVRYGNIAASTTNSRGGLIIYMTTAPGDSGAGVFNYDGRLVGIIIARQVSKLGNDGFSFMIPGPKICEELVDMI